VEAALIAEYPGRDPIAEWWRGEITFRKLVMFVDGLPLTSAMHRAERGHDWSDLNYQVAQLTDLFADSVQWQTKPDRVWRPPARGADPDAADEAPARPRRSPRAVKAVPGQLSLAELFARATQPGG